MTLIAPAASKKSSNLAISGRTPEVYLIVRSARAPSAPAPGSSASSRPSNSSKRVWFHCGPERQKAHVKDSCRILYSHPSHIFYGGAEDRRKRVVNRPSKTPIFSGRVAPKTPNASRARPGRARTETASAGGQGSACGMRWSQEPARAWRRDRGEEDEHHDLYMDSPYIVARS